MYECIYTNRSVKVYIYIYIPLVEAGIKEALHGAHFTCFTCTKSTNTDAEALRAAHAATRCNKLQQYPEVSLHP